MHVAWLTPLAALVGLAGLLSLAAFGVAQARAARARRALGLAEPPRGPRRLAAAALAAVALLLAGAAAQPVLVGGRTRHVRTDAQLWFVLDISRSMLASSGPGRPGRLDRAKAFARALRSELPDVPSGIASLTDRLLPALFPSPDVALFDTTLAQAIAVGVPPPSEIFTTQATTLEPLDALRSGTFFADGASRRLVVLLTDGESRPFSFQAVGRLLRQPPAIGLVVVRFWQADERVFTDGRLEAAYRPDPTSGFTAARLAAAAGGRAFDEGTLGGVPGAVRQALGDGPSAAVGEDRGHTPLAPWLALAALAPLAYLVVRRNLA